MLPVIDNPQKGYWGNIEEAERAALKAHALSIAATEKARRGYKADRAQRERPIKIWYLPHDGYLYTFFASSEAQLSHDGAVRVSTYTDGQWQRKETIE